MTIQSSDTIHPSIPASRSDIVRALAASLGLRAIVNGQYAESPMYVSPVAHRREIVSDVADMLGVYFLGELTEVETRPATDVVLADGCTRTLLTPGGITGTVGVPQITRDGVWVDVPYPDAPDAITVTLHGVIYTVVDDDGAEVWQSDEPEATDVDSDTAATLDRLHAEAQAGNGHSHRVGRSCHVCARGEAGAACHNCGSPHCEGCDGADALAAARR